MDHASLPYVTIDLLIGDCDAALTIMCRGKRFHIQFTTKDLRGSQASAEPSPLEQQFLQFRRSMDDELEAMEAFEDWVLSPCIPYIRQLAPPRQSSNPLSLEEYFNPVTFTFNLVNVNGRLEAIQRPDDPAVTRYLAPKVSISEQTVSSVLLQGLPCISASQLEILPGLGTSEEEYDAIPKAVRVIGTERQFYFKAAFDEHSFRRELDTLLRIRSGCFPNDLHVSRLAGVVTWNDGISVMGFLLEYIHHSNTLDSAAADALPADRVRWAQQIQDTVKQLHDIKLVWGDVKPDNVLIESKGDACVIDFGGGYAAHWVDEDLEGTRDGDLQGVSRIRKFLGL